MPAFLRLYPHSQAIVKISSVAGKLRTKTSILNITNVTGLNDKSARLCYHLPP